MQKVTFILLLFLLTTSLIAQESPPATSLPLPDKTESFEPVSIDPTQYFTIIDKNEAKEENPVPVPVKSENLPKLIDKNEAKEPVMPDSPKAPVLKPRLTDENEPREGDDPDPHQASTKPVWRQTPERIPPVGQIKDDGTKAPLVDPDIYEPDNAPNDYTTINVNTYELNQSHTIHNSSDVDWYRFYAIIGMTYSFWSTGALDGVIYLYQDNGTTLIASDDQGGTENNFHLNYTATNTGWYKLKVMGYYNAVGAYMFFFSYTAPADSYEPDNSTAVYTSITVSSNQVNQTHTLHNNTDQDWFQFYAYTGRIYSFYSTYNTDTVIYLYEADGTTLIDSNDQEGAGNNFLLEFQPTVATNYKLKIVGYSGSTGAYVFSFLYRADPDDYEPDDSSGDFTNIIPYSGYDYYQNHTLHSGTDHDWFRFHATATGVYHFWSTGNTDNIIYLYEDNGTTLLGTDDQSGDGNNFSLTYTCTTTGYYKIRIVGYNEAVGEYKFYYNYTAPADSYETDNSAADYTTLSVSGQLMTQSHSLHNDPDEDWYKFQGWLGRAYSFYSTYTTDTQVYLYAADGTTLLASDDDDGDGNNFHLDFVPTTSAYYYLKVIGFAAYSGFYDFCYYAWADPDAYEPDNTVAAYNYIYTSSIVQTQDRTIHNPTDQDWLRFYGIPGKIYNFTSMGNTDVVIYLYNEAGTTLITSDDDNGEGANFMLDYTPAILAYYNLKIVGYGTTVGAYTLQYSCRAEPDPYEPDDTAAEANSITVTTTLQIENHTVDSATDEDWFRFQGVAGRVYTFYSTGYTDNVILLYHDNGTTLINSDDDDGEGGNFLLQFIPASTAYYKLKIKGYGGDLGEYTFYYSYSTSLTVPTNVSISITGGNLTLQWNAVPMASNYRIEGSDNPVTGFVVVGSSAITSWTTVVPGVKKFYRVVATN